ncbi:IclR family transcriptional regulator [Gracilibacillus sp. HCP3S3_G5_1]|uniref:IclR family transcriptional regulator n=1 Tax=unclassified Gracilibacillus TaxID=2625209 RepID=UPI003F8A30C3
MGEHTNNNLKTVDRILSLLECFTDDNPEWGVTELSIELGLYKSVVHRMLSTLEDRGYITKNPDTKKYKLGLKLFELGMVVSRQMNLKEIAKPVIEDLSQLTDETVLLTIVDGKEGVCIEKLESGQSIKSTSQLGKRVPLYAGAPTKLLLAYLPEDTIKNISKDLKSFTKHTITDPEQLKEELLQIRRQGFCYSFSELDYGSAGVAYPIFNHQQKVIASLSVVGPEFRMQDRMDEISESVKKGAQTISEQLGMKVEIIH